MNTWQLPDDYVKQYLAACKEAATNDAAFKVFRRHPIITTIIENGNEEFKQRTIHELLAVPPLASYFIDGDHYPIDDPDSVGSPEMTGKVSPTTVRYLYILLLIKKLISKEWLATVIEIGGGYGGQCRIMNEFCIIHRYIIYDLPEVQALQKRYLKVFEIDAEFPEKITVERSFLLIAWCSWSELNLETRKEYLPLIAKAKHIFICSNYNFSEDLELIKSVHPDVKVYSDHLYQNIIYK